MRDIAVRSLRKRYGEKTVFDGLDLTLPAGRVSALLAPSGWGKTTLLRLLLGLERPDAGEIEGLEGVSMAAVFQEDRLCMDFTPVANIRLGAPKCSREDVTAAMAEMELTGCERQPVRELSGGMRRRVALLRALLAPSEVLLLDEPFKGLDEELRRKVIAVTAERCRGRTVLLVTHDPREAELMGAERLPAGEAGGLSDRPPDPLRPDLLQPGPPSS